MFDTIKFNDLLYEWLSRFGIPVYRGVLPSGMETGSDYIKYISIVGDFASTFIQPIKIYSIGTTSYGRISRIVRNISNEVQDGFLIIDNDMSIRICKGSPFYQDLEDENEKIRTGYVNLEITIY